MATQPSGIVAPAGTDAFAPDSDMRALVNSIHGRIHILAANATARAALVSSCGWTPTATDPLVVFQTDTKSMWSYDGTGWFSPVTKYHTQTVAQNAANGATLATMTIPAQRVAYRGFVSATGQIGGGSGTGLAAIALSATGATVNTNLNQPLYIGTAGLWFHGRWVWVIDVAANAQVTLTFSASSNVTVDYRGEYIVDIAHTDRWTNG